ncbi:hypothetical protein [Phytopseudomonas dryadis]|uniref:hypothetical protein n=1 Tax=Phytopseudomonas dryadis TaxID=2487520 RepID=UPI0010384A02|nr:hypothetical protein [Pseudomonas dryadis]
MAQARETALVRECRSPCRVSGIFYGLPSLAATLRAVASDVKNGSRPFFMARHPASHRKTALGISPGIFLGFALPCPKEVSDLHFSAGKKRGGFTRPLFFPYSLISNHLPDESLPAMFLVIFLDNLCLSLSTVPIVMPSRFFTTAWIKKRKYPTIPVG